MKRGLRNGPAFLRTWPVYTALKKSGSFQTEQNIRNWKKKTAYLVPGCRPATNQQKPVGNPNLDDDKALRTKAGETRKPMTNHDQAWWLDLQGCWNKPIKVWCHRMMGQWRASHHWLDSPFDQPPRPHRMQSSESFLRKFFLGKFFPFLGDRENQAKPSFVTLL